MSDQPDDQVDAGGKKCRIFVRGLGLWTPLGHGAWAGFAALLSGRTLAQRAPALPDHTEPVNMVRALGGVSIAQHSGTDPAVELAERAIREAADEAGLSLPGLPLFLGTSKGAVHALTEARQRLVGEGHVRDANRDALPALAGALGPHGYLSHHLEQRTGARLRRHVVAACASSLAAVDQARRWLLQTDESDAAIVASSDAALLPLFIHTYRRLGVLAPLTLEAYRQYPLDERRGGFMLSEAGAAILLQRRPANAPPPQNAIELVDTDLACEGHDLIRPAPKLPAVNWLAKRLLKHQPDVIHPHAPGTADHDQAETHIYSQQIRNQKSEIRNPHLYACKGALGHSLGAAGLSALVVACLCLRTGRLPPMPWLEQPIQINGLTASPEAARCARHGCHAVLAAGFGGHAAGAVLRGVSAPHSLSKGV